MQMIVQQKLYKNVVLLLYNNKNIYLYKTKENLTMGDLMKVFLFADGQFAVAELDSDNVQTEANDGDYKVCAPKRELIAEIMDANPDVIQFYIDTTNGVDVANFDANFKEIV